MKNKSVGKITSNEALRELWSRGVLTWKLHDTQKKMYKSYADSGEEITVVSCSRQLGKTYLLCIIAIEQCIKNPNSIVKFVCPKKSQVRSNLAPKMRQIFEDCPAEMKPEYRTNDHLYAFPNGSQIQMAGTDNGHYETLRGTSCHLWIIDEAGFCDDLNDVVMSVLSPTTDTTGGRGLLVSTPSKSSDHEFVTDFLKPAEDANKLIKYTIYDSPLIDKVKLHKIISRYPLKEKDPKFRREYLCEILNSGDLAIIPEFTKELEDLIVKDVSPPGFFDSYVGMDIGGTDFTAVIFGYWDFLNARLVIQDELVFGKAMGNIATEMRIDTFAQQVKLKEEKLWTSPTTGEFKSPYLRIADNNNIIFINDLSWKHNLTFLPTRKDNRDAAINTMRQMLAEQRIIISPKCENLIAHLRHGTWAKSKKTFTRSKKYGHFDFIPALYYLVRNIQETRNPYPRGMSGPNTFTPPNAEKQHTAQEDAWLDMFRSRKPNSQKLRDR